jgi:hypothetical protein
MHVGTVGLANNGALRHVGNFAGAIVSMPHKMAVVDLLDELTQARLVGAVNVICRRADGRLVGTILDGEGFVGGLRAGHRVAGARCLLAGAAAPSAGIRVGATRLRVALHRQSDAVEGGRSRGARSPRFPASPSRPIDRAGDSTSRSTARRSA